MFTDFSKNSKYGILWKFVQWGLHYTMLAGEWLVQVEYPLSKIPKSENLKIQNFLHADMNTMLYSCRYL
jgi:hypothetical protein